jgi:uncharacterized lipoprotein YmbA
MRTPIHAAALTAVVFTLAGCSILAPQVDPSRFYVLTATSNTTGDVGSPRPDGPTIGVGPIRLPDYLDRSQLVTRLGPNRVVFSDLERWAEPLEGNLSRVLVENLTFLLNTEKIVSLPALVPIPVRYEVPIAVQRFESDDEGTVELIARWAVRASADGKILHAAESRITEKGGSHTDEVVAALSRALGRLSEEIAAVIRRLSSS